MNQELHEIISSFNKILHLFAIIDKKPKDYGTGDLLFVSEVHAIHVIGDNPEINITRLSELLGVTKGATSQTVKRLFSKRYVARYKAPGNNKEVNLRLSDKGYVIYRKHEDFEKDLLSFTEELYNNASALEIDLVKRLFQTIHDHMKIMHEKTIKV